MSAFEQAGPPVVVVNEAGRSPFVLLCEHASRLFPAGYGRLGLPAAELDRHIAWDLGAAEVAMRLACILDAPLFLAGYSRLLIDLNRPPESPTRVCWSRHTVTFFCAATTTLWLRRPKCSLISERPARVCLRARYMASIRG